MNFWKMNFLIRILGVFLISDFPLPTKADQELTDEPRLLRHSRQGPRAATESV
jgi:hypothetical protein